MTDNQLLPSDFLNHPWGSVARNWEKENVARNIMVILNRTGNTWRELSPEEYEAERMKDGWHGRLEAETFKSVVHYTKSADTAFCFCKDWAKPSGNA